MDVVLAVEYAACPLEQAEAWREALVCLLLLLKEGERAGKSALPEAEEAGRASSLG